MRDGRRTARLALLLALAALPASAAEYPVRPIRLIIGTAPAGAQSENARALVRLLEGQLGQPIIVDNRPGANGIIAYETVAKSAPDGYTLLHTSIAFAINKSVYKKLPFDIEKDFTPITNIVTGQGAILVVHPAVPARSVKELIALGRGARLSYSSPGVGNPLHLIAESFNVRAGLGMTHVPFKGAGPALQAVVAGEIQVMFSSSPPAVPQIKAGRVRALGYSGAARLDALPDVPTVHEAGLEGFKQDSGWHAWFAPPRTPAPIVAKLHAEISKALENPKLREFYLNNGYQPSGDSPAVFQKIFRADIRRWGEIARLAKIEPQ